MRLIFLFIPLLLPFLKAWSIGYYSSGEDCLPWESSWREWTSSDSCTTWEVFMFLNTTTNLWQYWNDGEYYDHSLDVWTSWGGSCTGYWSYQSSWFSCPPSQSFDLETFSWISDWESPKVQINDTVQFEMDSIWRENNYYVDPLSEELIELGTRTYPYRTLFQIFSEIMNHKSHSDVTVTIYIKENANLYIEDSEIFLLGISQVSIQSYSDTGETPKAAIITTTDSSVEKKSKKAAFNIMKNTTVDVSSLISSGSFTDEEISIAGRIGGTIQLVRTSISITNVIVKRKAASTSSGLFLDVVYLQNRTVSLSKYL